MLIIPSTSFASILLIIILNILDKSSCALYQLTSLGSSLTNNYTLVENVTYDLNFSIPSQSIQVGSTVGLKFSQRYAINSSTLANCRVATSSAANPTTPTTCTVTYYSGSKIYQIVMTGVFASTTTYSFLRLGFRIHNPYGVNAQPINVTIYDPASTMVGYGLVYMTTYTASIMTSCSISSSSPYTGVNATHTYTFTPPQRMIANSYIMIDLPIWDPSSNTGSQGSGILACTGQQGTDVTGLSCGIQSPITSQTINITDGLVSANRSSSTVQISLSMLKNPWSLQPFGPITISLMYDVYLSQVCTNVYNTVTLPNTLAIFTFTISNLVISATNTNNIRITFFQSVMFPKPNNRVKLQFSSQLSITYMGSLSVYSTTSTSITVAGVTTSSIGNFTVINPPSTRPFSFTLTTYKVDTGTGQAYAIDTRTTNAVSCTAGVISAVTVTPSVTDVNAITTYTIEFTVRNRLQIGSFINVVLPIQLAIQVGTASCTLSTHTCTIVSTSNASISITSAIAINTPLTLTITSVKNANQARPTDTFAIYTYYDSLYDSLVDRITSGVTTTMTAKSITSVTITPTLYTNYALTSYKFDITLLDPIPAGGYITIQFPTTTSPEATTLTSASFSTTSCSTTQPTTNIVNITNCFSSVMSNLALSLTLNNIRNPPSYKPTLTLKISIHGAAGYLINSITSGLTIAMNVSASTTTFGVAPSSSTVGDSTSYMFSITHVIPVHAVGDYAVITIPALMALPATLSCTAVSGIATATCIALSTTQLKITYTATPATSIQLSLANMINYLIGDQPVTYSLTIYDSSNYIMEQYPSLAISYTQSTITSAAVNNDDNIALGQVSNVTITVSNMITLYASLSSSLTRLDIVIPVEFGIGTVCTSTSGTCGVHNGTAYRVSGIGLALSNVNITFTNLLLSYFSPTSTSFQLVYTYNDYNVSVRSAGVTVSPFCTSPCQRCNILRTSCESCLPAPNTQIYFDPLLATCNTNCQSGKYADSNNICQICIPPCATCYDASNCSSCTANTWLYSNSCVLVCPSTYYNHSNGKCELCQTPCNQCKSLTYCVSCAVGYLSNNWCVNASSCPTGTYANTTTKVCQLCKSPCSACSTSQSTCTACIANTWLYLDTCVSVCPSAFFNNSNGKCDPCQSPCNQCKSLSYCINCATGYLYNNWCVNATSCPNGTYANTTLMTCQPCKSPCSSCSVSQSNCTTCVSPYYYYDNLCVQNCPTGMYASGIYCFNCVPPCSACSVSASSCTSCSTGYLSNNTCVDAASCPLGTYANSTDMKCKTCPTGCTSCTNSTNCSSCNSAIYLFYNFQCYIVCPDGTYQSSITCVACTPPCLTCRSTDTNCTSCISPKVYYSNQCLDTCPAGTYNNSNNCSTCTSTCAQCISATTCTSCNGSRYLSSNQCVSVCPAGSYGDALLHTCTTCLPPCTQCTLTATTCTKCISPQLQYNYSCVPSCPSTYFQINGSCRTCPNCLNCLDSTTCLQCKPSFYQYNGICYTQCPLSAPIPDQNTNTCGRCDSTCLTCANVAKNCTSCYGGVYLYKGTCLVECPLGFIQDIVSGTCKQPLIGNVIYFPFCFLGLFCAIIGVASKCLYPNTENITQLGAVISLCEFGSWCLFTYIIKIDYNLQSTLITIGMYMGLIALLLSICMGTTWNIVMYKQYQYDKGLNIWKQSQNGCTYSYRVVSVLSCCSFRFFRFLYSKFFNRVYFMMYIADGQRFLTTTNRLTFISLIVNSLPMIGISAFVLYKKQIYDQTFFCALDTVILGFIAAVLLTIDSSKDKDYFQGIKSGLPFLKYRNMGNQQSMAGQSLLSKGQKKQREQNKSQINDQKQRDNIFKKITWLPNINKFGHLNVIENQLEKQQTKSLPQINKLSNYKQYQHNQLDFLNGFDNQESFYKRHQTDGSRVIDEELFFMKQEEQKRRKQEEEQRQRLKQQEEERQRKKKLQEEEEQRKRLEEQRRRKQLMEQDQNQRVGLQFPDLAAIDKVQNKNGKNRKNPLDLLSNCKKVDEKVVDQRALKKLQQIGKKNGIDPNFMKQTFGVEKNHNPQLLNQIIDKHNGVKRQAVKQLFSDQNNPQVLQQIFGKNSKMDPKKLKQILNDPNSAQLIKKMLDKQEGILSPEMAKQLLQQNSKYSKQFTKNLLSSDSGMDPQKLKTLLKDSNAKGKDSPLKALKKIGGQNLQNTPLLNNMLGEGAVLNPQNFTRVANDLSLKAIENIFANKSKNSDIIASKLLNNKKINLKNLAPILQDEQLLQQLAQALGQGDPNLQQNLLNLFKNAENIDPAKLKQMLADPIIREKLLTKPVDPQFLVTILDKNSKSDLNILSETLKQMSDELIEQTFRFDPEKNTDFKNLAQLFDANSKTDPVLVSKMLQPDMVRKLYVKGNDTKMLNKLVQKGNQFDPEVIKNVYGDQRNNIFDTRTDNLNKMNLINFDEQKCGNQVRSQKQYSLGFQKNKSQNQINMSRTAGGPMNFLGPAIPFTNKNKMLSKDFNDQDGWTSQGDQQQQYDDDGQIRQEDGQQITSGMKKKKKGGKRMKKKLVDVRHPSQQIYLQRIQAPHEHAMRKASIRKKKKKVTTTGIMDEDNDIFDMDF